MAPHCAIPRDYLSDTPLLHAVGFPEGPARHLNASRQKLTPHCLAAIFDSQLPSPKLSLKMPPKLPLPHNRGHFLLFQNCPRGEGNCAAIERQKLSRGNFCLAASRCLSGPSGFLASQHGQLGAIPPPPCAEPLKNYDNFVSEGILCSSSDRSCLILSWTEVCNQKNTVWNPSFLSVGVISYVCTL